MWVNYMQETSLERYRSLLRFGLLAEKAIGVNEEAYELLFIMEQQLLEKEDTSLLRRYMH